MGLMSSLGKRPSRLQGSMMGMTSFSMNLRVESRTRRSSSESRVSNSIKSTPLNFNAIRLVPYECERSAQTRTPVERKLLMVIEGGREGQSRQTCRLLSIDRLQVANTGHDAQA